MGLVLAGVGCACTPDLSAGPSTWPQADELRQATRPQTEFEAAEPVVNAVLRGGGLEPLLHESIRERLRPADQRTALRRLRSQLGPIRGVAEERLHREEDVRWYSGLWVCGGAIPNLALLQFALDEEGKVLALTLRKHLRRDQATFPAESYETVNRFRVPSTGTWTVTQGGPTPETNKHHGHHQQRWAYDLVVRKNGSSRRKKARTNQDHYAYGMPYLAPAPGTVVYARNDRPETPFGNKGEGGGNGVIIDHGFGEYTASWHFIPGSVQVEVGDPVNAGDVLGTVGNSGRSSQPHIHIHVASGPPGSGSDGLPLRFADVTVRDRPLRLAEPLRDDRVTSAGSPAAPEQRRRRGVYLEL